MDVVTDALGLDGRIGSRYLKGAAPYGGPCFPRDNKALASLARSVNAEAVIAEATETFNRQWTERLVHLALNQLPDGGTAAVLGLAYKPNTNVIEESAGLLVALELAKRGIKVVAHDPQALGTAQSYLQRHTDSITLCEKVGECIQRADVILIATPWQEYKALGLQSFARKSHPRVVIDCWRIYPEASTRLEGVTYVPVGRGVIPSKD